MTFSLFEFPIFLTKFEKHEWVAFGGTLRCTKLPANVVEMNGFSPSTCLSEFE